MTTLFERIGGENAVDAAVNVFYDKVLADPTINHFFENIDMDTQANKQKAFLTLAFGGPNNYTGKDLRAAHAHLNLTEEHFQAVAKHLQETLQDLGLDEDNINEIMEIAASTHDDVLNL